MAAAAVREAGNMNGELAAAYALLSIRAVLLELLELARAESD